MLRNAAARGADHNYSTPKVVDPISLTEEEWRKANGNYHCTNSQNIYSNIVQEMTKRFESAMTTKSMGDGMANNCLINARNKDVLKIKFSELYPNLCS